MIELRRLVIRIQSGKHRVNATEIYPRWTSSERRREFGRTSERLTRKVEQDTEAIATGDPGCQLRKLPLYDSVLAALARKIVEHPLNAELVEHPWVQPIVIRAD